MKKYIVSEVFNGFARLCCKIITDCYLDGALRLCRARFVSPFLLHVTFCIHGDAVQRKIFTGTFFSVALVAIVIAVGSAPSLFLYDIFIIYISSCFSCVTFHVSCGVQRCSWRK